MSLYTIDKSGIAAVARTTFPAEQIKERGDLQAMLRDKIDVIAPDTMVLAEEFGDWEEGHRRIDLLLLDKNADLVVCELKRTDAGGYMELQAIRYAAMISTMTFEQAVRAHATYLKARGRDEDASEAILKFLDWDSPDQAEFNTTVRLVLVSGDFSRELTTSVIWLLDRDLDIRCVRMRPYRVGDRLLLDVQQVLPLPEAEEYIVKVREKERQERKARSSGPDYTRFDLTIGDETWTRQWKRNAIYKVARHLCTRGHTPEEIGKILSWKNNLWLPIEGELSTEEFCSAAEDMAAQDQKRFEPYRWFCKEGQLIHCKGRTYAFTNQWGGKAIQGVGELAARFPGEQIAIEKTVSDDS